MGRVRRIIVAFAAAAALAASGCGSRDTSTSSAESDIQSVLTKVFTDFRPDDCTEVFTHDALEQRLLGQAYDDPVEECEKDADEDRTQSDEIGVDDLEIDGDSASVTVTPDGGRLDGTHVHFELIDADGWKIDSFGLIDIYDLDRYVASLDFTSSNDVYTDADVDCMKDYFTTEVPLEDLERIYVDGDAEFAYDAVTECLGDGSDRRAVETITRRSLTSSGLDTPLIDCIIKRARGAFDFSVQEISEDSAVEDELTAALKDAAASCGGVADSDAI